MKIKNSTLAGKYPELALQWHPTKNGKLTPYDVGLRGSSLIWWKCEVCGYEWQSSLANRTQRNKITKCFRCSCLAIKNVDIAKEWHPTKNKKLTPYDVSYGSDKNVWWKCQKCNFEWEARVQDRNKGEGSCPLCNCLVTQSPHLAREWHPTKNKELTPCDVSYGSKKNVWWKCYLCDYEWQGMVYIRHEGQKNCIRCNSLGIKSPHIAKEWHPTKNKKLTPYDVSYGSNLPIWWKCCLCNHDWIARPQSRQDGSGCPNCSKVILKNGVVCDSLIDAYFYLTFKEKGIKFLYNKKYGDLGKQGRCRYDFYFVKENKYVEVTSYDNKVKWWFSYLRNIVLKKKHAEKIGIDFEFIQKKLSVKETNYVRSNMRTK